MGRSRAHGKILNPRGDPKPTGGIPNLCGESPAGISPSPRPTSPCPHHHGLELHATGEEAAAAELQGFPQVLLAGFGDAWRGRGTGLSRDVGSAEDP